MSAESSGVKLQDLVVRAEPWDASVSNEAVDVYDSDGFSNGEPIVRASRAVGKGANRVQAGDVLLSTSARGPRRTWVVGEARGRQQVASADWQVLRCELLEPAYLRHLLVSNDAQAHVGAPTGTKPPGKPNRTAAAELLLPVRPVALQQQIAQVLDHVDALRVKRALVVRRIGELEQSVFAATFGNSSRSAPERMSLPAVLCEAPLRGVDADLQSHGSFPVLRPADIGGGRLNVADARRVSYSDAMLARTVLADGDVLFACDPARSDVRCAIARPGRAVWFVHARLWRLRCDTKRLLPEYLRAWLLSEAGRSDVLRVWTADRRATGEERLTRLSVPVPDIADQRAYAEAVGAIERLEGRVLAGSERLDELLGVLRDLAFRGELQLD